MESIQSISKLEIPIDKLFYNKDSKILSIEILGFTFIGHYKKSTTISEILDDIYKSLPNVQIERDDIHILDAAHLHIHGNTKLKNLKLREKIFIEEEEDKRKKIKKEGKIATKNDIALLEEEQEEAEMEDYKRDREETSGGERRKSLEDQMSMLRSEEKQASKKAKAAPAKPSAPPPPGAGPSAGLAESMPPPRLDLAKTEAVEEPQPTRYDINMGFQYFSVMMEQQSYFFYVYFSFKELIIQDEEGKTVYKTKFTIITTKEEPPILDLRIEGEGFEVHPLSGKVEVKKEFVNPPVMIFSVLPVKSKISKKKKKVGEKRFLHVYVDFEGKTVSHSILSITVQPKHFHLDLGPFHIDLTKTQAMLISIISILITIVSVAYSLFSLDISGPTTDILTGIIPGVGSLIFFGTFIYTLFKEGIYPIQQQINSLLNFDKGITTLK